MVKFSKCFAEFMMSIALLKELGGQEFDTTIEVTKLRFSYKANKLRYIDSIRGTPRDTAIKEWEIEIIP